MIRDLHHVQIAIPAGSEQALRDFYGSLIGMPEIPKPALLAARGGLWFAAGDRQLHCGVEADFRPARKAHPCFVVDDIDELAQRLTTAGVEVRWSDEIPELRRFHAYDPVGNRLEFQQGDGGSGPTSVCLDPKSDLKPHSQVRKQ